MKKGEEWESYIHYVYSTVLNLKGEKIQVSKNTTFILASGETYEVDVYYEFYKAGVRHRVAIECKDWKRPISQGQVLEFHQKIKNIGNELVGVIVSRNGFQEGAENTAKRHGVLTLDNEGIPTIPQLLVQHITASFIHEPDLIGEPFWCLAEYGKDKLESTGTYYAFPEGLEFNLPLFISKKHAESFLDTLPDKERFGVFGLPQYKLRSLVAFAYKDDLKLAIIYGTPLLPGSVRALPITLDARALHHDYLLTDFPAELVK